MASVIDRVKKPTSEDKEFLEWCADLFNYQWEKAGPFDEGKLKHEV